MMSRTTLQREWSLVPLLAASTVVLAQSARQPDWTRLEAETMRHFQALVRLDTSNPPGNEVLVTDYLKQVLEREGIPVQTFALEPNRPNLVARIMTSGGHRAILVPRRRF